MRNLAEKVLRGERSALSRAITLAESTSASHAPLSEYLMNVISSSSSQECNNFTSSSCRRRSVVGIAGPPGAGKSTFIESFGLHLLDRGHRVAVLAIDPSSARNGGSILGDKTRMFELSRHEHAYVRPSPNRGVLGGICLGTPEAVRLCEVAGFDYVLVETVGVGQSEVEVDSVVDMMVLLVSPGGGDSLQGVKRGIVEMADMVVVNKNDGELAVPATRAVRAFREALTLMRPKPSSPFERIPVLKCSSLERIGLDDIALKIEEFYNTVDVDRLRTRRSNQIEHWIWSQIHAQMWARLQSDENVRKEISELCNDIVDMRYKEKEMSVSSARGAARLVLDRHLFAEPEASGES